MYNSSIIHYHSLSLIHCHSLSIIHYILLALYYSCCTIRVLYIILFYSYTYIYSVSLINYPLSFTINHPLSLIDYHSHTITHTLSLIDYHSSTLLHTLSLIHYLFDTAGIASKLTTCKWNTDIK